MKRLSIIFSLIICAIISYGQPIPIPGVKPTSFPLKAVLDGSEELYTQRDINGINNRRFLVSQVADYIRLLNPHDSLITKGDSICIKGGNCIYLGTVLNFVDSLRISNDTLYYHKGTVWRPLVLPSSTDSIFYTGNDTLPLYTVLTTGNAPPGSPVTGATYWVGASPTGSWAGHAQDIATWTGSAWTFHDGVNGDYMYNAHTGYTYQWRSPKWVQVSGIPILNAGNSLSSGVTIGTNNAKALNLETNNTVKVVIQPGGSVKINSLASNTYPLVGVENDGTLKKIYLTSDFFIDIDSLRYIGSGGGGGGTTYYAGNGMKMTNDSLHLGGKIIKEGIEFFNSTDTIFGMDSLGRIEAPGLYEVDDFSEIAFNIDSNFVITKDLLIDSLLLNFGLLPSQFCHTTHTAGVVNKLNKKDGVLFSLDSASIGSCRDSTLYGIIQFKFARVNLLDQVFVDSFGVFISGYDTLNVNGNPTSEGFPLWFLNQGHKIIYNHFSQNGNDSLFNALGVPYDIGTDTIGFLNYHFPEPAIGTIDSVTLTILAPLKGNTDYKFYFDRIALVFPNKPILRDVVSWGGKIITIPYSNAGGSSLVTGNGVAIDGNEVKLGNLIHNAILDYANNDYDVNNAAYYGINCNQANIEAVNNLTLLSTNGDVTLMGGNGHNVILQASNSTGAVILDGSENTGGNGVYVNNTTVNNSTDYILGTSTSTGGKISLVDKSTIGIPTIYQYHFLVGNSSNIGEDAGNNIYYVRDQARFRVENNPGNRYMDFDGVGDNLRIRVAQVQFGGLQGADGSNGTGFYLTDGNTNSARRTDIYGMQYKITDRVFYGSGEDDIAVNDFIHQGSSSYYGRQLSFTVSDSSAKYVELYIPNMTDTNFSVGDIITDSITGATAELSHAILGFYNNWGQNHKSFTLKNITGTFDYTGASIITSSSGGRCTTPYVYPYEINCYNVHDNGEDSWSIPSIWGYITTRDFTVYAGTTNTKNVGDSTVFTHQGVYGRGLSTVFGQGYFGIGDLDNAANGTNIEVNDKNRAIYLRGLGTTTTNNYIATTSDTTSGSIKWRTTESILQGSASSLSTGTNITTTFGTYIMDFTLSGSGSSSNELPALSSVSNGFTVRIRRTDNNSSFTATIIPASGSGDIITDLDNANVSAIGISDGVSDNYLEFTAFINGVNGYSGSTKWVVMNKH